MADLKDAYTVVFNDLCQCPMFQGYYDAANGNRYFMYGIETVMEVIANRGYDDDFADKFSQQFAEHMERRNICMREVEI